MFCPNCGIEIKNPKAFCPNCGTKLPQEMQTTGRKTEEKITREVPMAKPQQKAPKKKSGKSAALRVIVPIVIVGVAAALFFACKQKKVINLNEFYTLTLSGYEGNGSAELTFDSEKFKKEYGDKLKLDESMIDALENDFYTISPSEKLKNGETITFKCSSQEQKDTLEASFGYKFEDLKDYKIEGLKEVTEYDPFKNITVIFKGTDGQGTVEIINPGDEVGKNLTYEVDNNGSLSNGDAAEVYITSDQNEIMEKYDAVLTESSKSFEVKGLVEPTPTPAPSPTPMPAETGPALRADFYKNGQITGTNPDYIVPDSLNRVLTYADIANLSARGLSFARNEMMARMGRGFKNQELANYFRSTSWYQETISPEVFDAQGLPAVVEANASLMMAEEKNLNGGELVIK